MPRAKKSIVKNIKKEPKNVEKEKIVFETVPDENLFEVIDGSSVGSIYDLANALGLMSEDTFYYHANDGKNDFANWVNDCMGEDELASSMINKNKHETHVILLKHIIEKLTNQEGGGQ